MQICACFESILATFTPDPGVNAFTPAMPLLVTFGSLMVAFTVCALVPQTLVSIADGRWHINAELTNRFNPQLVQFFKLADTPDPSHIYVFLDEHPDTLNDGFFVNRWDEFLWGNLPGSYHNGAANLSFADGHVETHRWVLGDTRRPFQVLLQLNQLLLAVGSPIGRAMKHQRDVAFLEQRLE
jgi:prepilin-type processing-associated H-X9-DG protein